MQEAYFRMPLLVFFVSLAALQTAPCYFPFFSYPKCNFPALDTFQHNGKNTLSYTMYSDFLSSWRKRACACLPASTKTSSSAAVHSCQSAAWCRDRLSRRKTGVVSGKVASRITPVSTKEPSSSVPDRGKSAS